MKKPPSAADNLTDVPTVAAYKEAFLAVRDPKNKVQVEMLKAHYRAPDHTATAEDLADAVGLAGASAANLQYAKYAGLLCKHLGVKPTYNVAILATFNEGEKAGEANMRWTLLPAVVTALEELGWVRAREDA